MIHVTPPGALHLRPNPIVKTGITTGRAAEGQRIATRSLQLAARAGARGGHTRLGSTGMGSCSAETPNRLRRRGADGLRRLELCDVLRIFQEIRSATDRVDTDYRRARTVPLPREESGHPAGDPRFVEAAQQGRLSVDPRTTQMVPPRRVGSFADDPAKWPLRGSTAGTFLAEGQGGCSQFWQSWPKAQSRDPGFCSTAGAAPGSAFRHKGEAIRQVSARRAEVQFRSRRPRNVTPIC